MITVLTINKFHLFFLQRGVVTIVQHVAAFRVPFSSLLVCSIYYGLKLDARTIIAAILTFMIILTIRACVIFIS